MQFALPHGLYGRPRVEVWPPLPLPKTTLGRCALLALLLHLWLVLMVGSAPGGSARPGEGVWGRLEVRLSGPAAPAETSTAAKAEAAPAPDKDNGPVGPARQQRHGGSVRPRPAPPTMQPGAAELGRWSPAPAEPSEAAATPEVPTARLEAPQDSVERLRRPAPPPPPATRPAAPQDLLKPLPSTAPIQAPAPAPAPAPIEAAPAPAAPVEAPPVLRSLPEAAPLVRPEAAAPSIAVPKLPTPAVQETLSAPRLQPEVTAPSPAPAPAAAQPAQATTNPAPSGTPATGSPDAGSRVGRDVATAPSASPGAPRKPLDLRLPVNGPIARQYGSSVLPVMPLPPEDKDKLAKDMEKAGRGDCRTEHAGAGILAAIPLAIDAARGKGCKW